MVVIVNGMSMLQDKRFNTTSRKFTFRNSALASGGSETICFEVADATSQKYLPFDNVQIKNQSASDVWIYFNGNANNKFLVASNSIENFPPSAVGGLYSVRIEEASSSAVSANKIAIIGWREPPSQDKLIQLQYEAKFKREDFV